MSPRALLIACLALTACGGRPTHTSTPVEPTRPVSLGHAAGLQIATLRRGLGERVWLALYLDAGSRDAHPPQVATVAALVAAGGGLRARVSPDGTEFSLDCRRQELRRCANRLASAMATREASRDAVAEASRELVHRRRRAAQDDARGAERLALEALFGPGVIPLGDAEADDGADPDAVERFLDANYGPSRALLVAVGDVDDASVAAAAEAFAGLPAASDAAAAREAPRAAGLGTARGEGSFIALSVSSPSLSQAVSLGRRLTDPLLGDPELRVHAFPLRGAAVTLLLATGEGATLERTRSLVRQLAAGRDALESGAMGIPGDPIEQGRAFAARWTARLPEEGDVQPEAAVAVGVVAPEPPERGALERARDEGLAELHTEVEGDVESARASVGGARVVARRTPGAPRVTVALSFLGGAGEEPPALHGRSALLAHLMTERCGVDAGTLGERLRALGGRATASVEASRFGVIFELPRARWRLAIDLAARCALRPPSARTDIDGVRTSLLTRRGPEDELAERSARLLSPGRPGRVAPEGGGVTLTRLTLGELEEAHDELVVRARVRAAVLGDVPADAAVARLARWLKPLPEGRAPSLRAGWPAEQGDPLADPETRGDVPRLLLSLRIPEGRADLAPWVRTLAHDLGRRLRGDGVRFEGSAAGSDALGSWLSVELALDRASIDGIPSRVAAALRELGAASRGVAVPSDAAARAWELTALPAPSVSPPELLEAFKRATPILQLRGMGRSPSLERLRL